jgi:regulator of replication initiation timing
MGNIFAKKERTIDSVILDELNRPLIPDIQHIIFDRLNSLEKNYDTVMFEIEGIKDSLKVLNENIAHRNVTFNTDVYKANESINNVCSDMTKLVKNDQILMKKLDKLKDQIDDIDKKSTIQGLYTSETMMQ